MSSRRRVGGARRGAYLFAVTVCFLLCLGTAWAQSAFDHLRFDQVAITQGEAAGSIEYRLGINAFTPAQLSYFLASIERFMLIAEGLPEGDHVTMRQSGRQGYIALTAYDTSDTPYYVLTLAAREPTGIPTRTGLQALWVLLADQLPSLVTSDATAATATGP